MIEVIIMKCCKVPGRVTLAGYMPVNEVTAVISPFSVVASINKKKFLTSSSMQIHLSYLIDLMHLDLRIIHSCSFY